VHDRDAIVAQIDVFQPDLLIVLNENRGILADAGAEGHAGFSWEKSCRPRPGSLTW
jgi:hypothetical protein